MKNRQNLIYFIVATGMLIYAVPQLKLGHGFRLETIFATVWLGLALIVMASHLFVLLKVDQEVDVEAKRLKPMKSSD